VDGRRGIAGHGAEGIGIAPFPGAVGTDRIEIDVLCLVAAAGKDVNRTVGADAGGGFLLTAGAVLRKIVYPPSGTRLVIGVEFEFVARHVDRAVEPDGRNDAAQRRAGFDLLRPHHAGPDVHGLFLPVRDTRIVGHRQRHLIGSLLRIGMERMPLRGGRTVAELPGPGHHLAVLVGRQIGEGHFVAGEYDPGGNRERRHGRSPRIVDRHGFLTAFFASVVGRDGQLDRVIARCGVAFRRILLGRGIVRVTAAEIPGIAHDFAVLETRPVDESNRFADGIFLFFKGEIGHQFAVVLADHEAVLALVDGTVAARHGKPDGVGARLVVNFHRLLFGRTGRLVAEIPFVSDDFTGVE